MPGGGRNELFAMPPDPPHTSATEYAFIWLAGLAVAFEDVAHFRTICKNQADRNAGPLGQPVSNEGACLIVPICNQQMPNK